MDSCQLGHKLGHSLRSNSPKTARGPPASLHMKKSQQSTNSTTPSPEVIHAKSLMRPPSRSSLEMYSDGDQLAKQRSGRVSTHPRSPLEPPPPPPPAVASTRADKRRRLNSSPVRPWKSPSPPPPPPLSSAVPPSVTPTLPVGGVLAPDGTGSSVGGNPPNKLLRHISVIREAPPIHYHPHHHYHHLVDQYAAAYHLYANGPSAPPSIGPQHGPSNANMQGAAHHWGAYN